MVHVDCRISQLGHQHVGRCFGTQSPDDDHANLLKKETFSQKPKTRFFSPRPCLRRPALHKGSRRAAAPDAPHDRCSIQFFVGRFGIQPLESFSAPPSLIQITDARGNLQQVDGHQQRPQKGLGRCRRLDPTA